MKELNYLTAVATRSSDYFILFVCLFVCLFVFVWDFIISTFLVWSIIHVYFRE